MGAVNTYEAYDAIEKRLAPRLEAFVRTGYYAELSAILEPVEVDEQHARSGCLRDVVVPAHHVERRVGALATGRRPAVEPIEIATAEPALAA